MAQLFEDPVSAAPIEFSEPERPVVGQEFAKSISAHVSLSAANRGADPAAAYEDSKNRLMVGDTSAVIAEGDAAYQPTIRERQEQALKILSLPGLDKNVYDSALKDYQLVSGKGLVKDLPSINASNYSAQEPAELPNQDEVLNERAAIFSEQAETADTIQGILDHYLSTFDTDAVKGVTDFYQAALLPENTAYANQVKTYIENRGWAVDSNWQDIISPGGAIQDIIKYGNSLPAESKKQFFQDFIDGVSQANGILGDGNQFAAFSIATAVGEHMASGSKYKWWEKLVDNLEVAGLVPTIATAVRGGVRIGRSVISKGTHTVATSLHPLSAPAVLAKSAPNTSGQVLSQTVLKQEIADMAATNPTDILLGLGVPKYQAADLAAAPANIVDEINKTMVYGQELVNKTLYNGFLLTKNDENTFIAQALNEANVLANKQPAMHVHNQQLLSRDENGIVWQNMFGNGNVGFAKKSEALEAARTSGVFDVESGAFEIVKFDAKTNSYTPVYNGARDYGKQFKDLGGEYFIRTTDARRYDPTFLTEIAPSEFPKQGRIYTLVAQAAKNFQFLKSAEALLPRELAKKVTSTFTSRVALKDSLDRLTSTYMKLGDEGKAKVMKVVDEGANYMNEAGDVVGKEFSYTELVGKGLDEAEIVSYYQIREVNKVSHAIRNRKMYEQLSRDQWKRVVDETADFDTIGRNVDDVEAAKSMRLGEVYDPYTRGVRKLNDNILDFLYSQGGRLVELKQPMRIGNKKFKHAFVKDRLNTTRELPLQVLNSVDGYAGPRIYEENYFIVAKNNDLTVDGLKAGDLDKTNVVHAAATQQEARALIDKLNANKTGDVEYSLKMGRELVGKADDFELEAASGGLYYSKRGQPLVGDNNRAARILDPVRAMEVNKNNISKVAVTEDLIGQMEKLWKASFGEKYSKGTFPVNRDEIINPGGLSEQEFLKAQAMWDLIGSYKRVGEPDKLYRNIMLSIAQTFDNARLGKVGAMLADPFYTSARKGSSPMSRIKSAAFSLSIAMRPMRQLYLQAAQHGYLGAVDMGALTTSYRQATGMAYLLSSEALQRGDGVVQGAKIAGMSTKDFLELAEGFRSSGLSRQVDTHQQVSGTLRDYQASLWDGKNLNYFKDKAIDTLVRKPLSIGRTLGFDTGERYNQLMTFLFAYNRLSKQAGKALKLTDKKVLDGVVGETNLLTFNMTGAGEFGIQNGWLRNTAQFMTFQIKSLQNILGSTQTFTKMERARIAGVTLALWGAGGFGLRQAWEKMKLDSGAEIAPTLDEWVAGGLAEMALNKAATELFQDDEDMAARIDFAGNTSPFSGIMFWEMVNWDKPLYEAAAGASMYTSKKLYDTMKYGGDLFFHNPSMESTEKLGLFAKRAAQLVPLISDTTKFYVAQKTGWLRDSHDDPKVRVSAAEAYSLLLGMYPTRAAQINLMTRTAKEKAKDLEDDANAFVDMMARNRGLDDADIDSVREEIDTMAAILSTLPDGDREIVRMHMYRALSLKSKKEQGEITLFWNKLARKSGSASQDVLNYIQSNQLPEAMQRHAEEMYDANKEQ